MSLGQSLDASLNSGEEIRFKQKNKKLMERLAQETHFSYPEVERLSIIYYKLHKISKTDEDEEDSVRRSYIKDVLHNGLDMTEYDLIPYILSYHDRSLTPYMSIESWIKMLSLFLRGTFEENISYCYVVYKSTGLSENIIRSNMLFLLKHSLIKDNNEDDEEGVKDMIDLLIKKFDFDRDGKISFNDFRQTVLKSPAFLQSFGIVLPSRLAVYSFKQTCLDNVLKM